MCVGEMGNDSMTEFSSLMSYMNIEENKILETTLVKVYPLIFLTKE